MPRKKIREHKCENCNTPVTDGTRVCPKCTPRTLYPPPSVVLDPTTLAVAPPTILDDVIEDPKKKRRR